MKTSKFHNLPLLLPTAILQLNFTWFCWNLAALQIFIHKLRSFKWFSHSDSLRKFPKVILSHIPLPKDSLIPQMSFSLEFLSDAPNYVLHIWLKITNLFLTLSIFLPISDLDGNPCFLRSPWNTTAATSHFISGLKSRVLKLTFF